jgi:hypothetical protein
MGRVPDSEYVFGDKQAANYLKSVIDRKWEQLER